jgi:hypothetical protein
MSTDAAVVVWCVLWVQVGVTVHHAVASVGEVGYTLQDGATGIRAGLEGAAGEAGRVPVVGGTFGKPFRSAAAAAGTIAGAGQDLGDRVTGLALLLGLVIALGPILSVVLVWGPARLRFARRAGESALLAGTPGGESLLALRALATRPVHQIAAVAPDAVEAWRRDDPAVVARLAALELAHSGVRPPGG